MKRSRMPVILGAALAASVAVAAPAAADDGPSLSPATVEAVILPGGSYDVDKSVHTPTLPPTLDLCLVVDLSGSYGDDLPNIKAVAPGLWDDLVAGGVADLQAGLASFVDFPISPFGRATSGDYAYRLDQDLTDDKDTWVAAVNAMGVLFGGDGPESQYEALYQVATGAGNDIPGLAGLPGDVAAGQGCSFREGATKVAVLTTDAPFHNAGDAGSIPYPGASAADTTAALQAAGVKVLGLKAPGAGGELDALATATGGAVVSTTSTSSDIAEAILAGLEDIDIEVSMTSDCTAETGGVVTTTFDPATRTVKAGEVAVFSETISVAADAPGGTYECKDWALINGDPMVDAAGAIIYETKTILVPTYFVTGGGQVTEGKGKNREAILNFGGNAGYMADGTLVGHWTFHLRQEGIKIHTTEITSIDFTDTGGDPAPPEVDVDFAEVSATARVNVGNAGWEDGCTVELTFLDAGEPGVDDEVSVGAVSCPVSTFSYTGEVLTGGNIQMHEGPKD